MAIRNEITASLYSWTEATIRNVLNPMMGSPCKFLLCTVCRCVSIKSLKCRLALPTWKVDVWLSSYHLRLIWLKVQNAAQFLCFIMATPHTPIFCILATFVGQKILNIKLLKHHLGRYCTSYTKISMFCALSQKYQHACEKWYVHASCSKLSKELKNIIKKFR